MSADPSLRLLFVLGKTRDAGKCDCCGGFDGNNEVAGGGGCVSVGFTKGSTFSLCRSR